MWTGIVIREKLGKKWHITPPIDLNTALGMLEPKADGKFIRHPVKWNDPKDFSRDQSIPVIASMGLYNDRRRLTRMWTQTKNRFYRFQNGDLCSFEHINLFRRSLGQNPQQLGDFQLIGSSAARCALGLNKDDVGDDLNHIVTLVLGNAIISTPLVDAAIDVYKNYRPLNYGCFMQAYRETYGLHFDTPTAEMIRRIEKGIKDGWKADCPHPLGALRWYFRAESGGSPALAELFAPIVDAVIGPTTLIGNDEDLNAMAWVTSLEYP